jgi:RNA polymerase sigma-70 factor (ECF subfamily)
VDSLDDLPDLELVRQIAGRRGDALAAVFRRHQAAVFRFCRLMVGSREAAEDLTQEVFIALGRAAERYDGARGSLQTYLFGIARNMIWQRYRRNRLRLEVSLDKVDEDSSALASFTDPADEMSRAQMLRRLRVAILQLPVHYREALVLCELNGLSYEEAAIVAGCPIGTIRSRLSRARSMLIKRCKRELNATGTPAGYPAGLRLAKNG